MKVLQFAFGGGDSEYLPHNHVKNSVVYPGTHDNTTLTDWWENGASEKEKGCRCRLSAPDRRKAHRKGAGGHPDR